MSSVAELVANGLKDAFLDGLGGLVGARVRLRDLRRRPGLGAASTAYALMRSEVNSVLMEREVGKARARFLARSR